MARDAPAQPSDRMLPARGRFRRRLFVETDALTFVELLERAGRHRTAMEEPLLTTIITDEAESAIPDQPFNRAVRHVDVPPRAVARRPCGSPIKFRSVHAYLNNLRHADSGFSSPVAG